MKEKKPAANRIAGNDAFRTPDRPAWAAGHTGLRDTADPACRRKGRTVWPLDFVRIRSLSVRAPELVEAFRGIPSSNIGDCTQRMNCMFDGIRPFNDLPLVGTAFTVRVPSGDNLVAQTALDYARPGDIIVIDAAGNTDRGMVGGMMLAYAEMRGLGRLCGKRSGAGPGGYSEWQTAGLWQGGKPAGALPSGTGRDECAGGLRRTGGHAWRYSGGRPGRHRSVPRQEAAELLEAARKNLQDEQEAMARMKAGTFPVEEHLESFTGAFLRRGGELI